MYKRKRQIRDETERRRLLALSNKIKELQESSIYESYLLDRMKQYSMILTESDIISIANTDNDEYDDDVNDNDYKRTIEDTATSAAEDGNDEEEEEITTDDDLTKSSSHKDDEGSSDDDNKSNSKENNNDDDIEMQRQLATEDDDGDDEIEKKKSSPFLPQRRLRGGCAICLSNSFEKNQKITWSSNTNCIHMFHHQCLLEWYTAVGIRTERSISINNDNNNRQLQQQQQQNEAAATAAEGGDNNNVNVNANNPLTLPSSSVCNFPTLCPCCRRDFFLIVSEEEEKK